MAQNAGWTDRAEKQSVDAIQTNNIPIIDCSLAFARLHDTFTADPDDETTSGQVQSQATPQHSSADARAHLPPRLAASAVTTVKVGDELIVPASTYPGERCSELGGAGWRVRVVRKRKRALLVEFVDARSDDDRRFAP
eukprot:2034885-Pleurochrysis_carterae.AAC.1